VEGCHSAVDVEGALSADRPLRFRRRVSLFPGLRVNLSRSGASVSGVPEPLAKGIGEELRLPAAGELAKAVALQALWYRLEIGAS
jgi:hypothetical protein